MSSPFFGSGGETNTRTKNYLTVGPGGSGASLYVFRASFASPLSRQKGHKEGEGERIGFKEAIHRETGWGGVEYTWGTECTRECEL